MVGRIATGEIEEPAVTEDGKNATAGAHGREGAGVANVVLKMMDVVGLIDARAAETPMVRGPYKKRDAEISN
jgi:hypothetical protein